MPSRGPPERSSCICGGARDDSGISLLAEGRNSQWTGIQIHPLLKERWWNFRVSVDRVLSPVIRFQYLLRIGGGLFQPANRGPSSYPSLWLHLLLPGSPWTTPPWRENSARQSEGSSLLKCTNHYFTICQWDIICVFKMEMKNRRVTFMRETFYSLYDYYHLWKQ